MKCESSMCEEPMCEQTTTTAARIVTGAKFSSFADFDDAFEEWKLTRHHPFRVASSETLRMPDGTTNNLFRYRYIVYHCAHYGAPRMRGAGKRPNQNYLPCGCRAMLRLNFSWAENALRITTLNAVHTGHDVSPDAYHRFSAKLRRASPPIAAADSVTSSTTMSASPTSTTTPSPRVVTPRRPTPKLARHHQQQPAQPHHHQQMNHQQHHMSAALDAGALQQLAARHLLAQVSSSMSATSSSVLTDSIKHETKENVARGMLFPSPAAAAASSPSSSGLLSPAAFNLGHILAAVQFQQQLQQRLQHQQHHMQLPPLPPPAQVEPLDLSAKERDGRNDDQKLDLIHPVLQGLNEHLLGCYGQDFDEKLDQMRRLVKKWIAASSPATLHDDKVVGGAASTAGIFC